MQFLEWPSQYMPTAKFVRTKRHQMFFLKEENELNTWMNLRCICRAGLLPTKRKYTVISPLPDFVDNNFYTDMTVDDCCRDAADLCVKYADGRTINLLWSGGIDSTTVFYALLNTGLTINVHCDPQVEREAPFIYSKLDDYSNMNVIMHYHDNTQDCRPYESGMCVRKGIQPFINEDNIFVTGEVGDQIFGTSKVFAFPRDKWDRDYRESIPERIDELTYDTTQYALKKEGVSLKQWMWAGSYMFKYQTVVVRSVRYYGAVASYAPYNNCFHFFDTPNWNRYGHTNQDENSSWQEPKGYKMPLKQWIYEQNGDEYYRDNKLKFPSSNRKRTYDNDLDGFHDNEEWFALQADVFDPYNTAKAAFSSKADDEGGNM